MASLLVLLLSVPLSVVEGRVLYEGGFLPGCTVRLESGGITRTAISDAEGHYRFEGVIQREHEIYFELEGFVESAQQRVLVKNEHVTVPDQDLRLSATTETITLACGSPCTDEPPANRLERPRCSEYEFNDALIESLAGGDASTIPLLEARYATADTYDEKHRIAGELLRKSKNDSQIWNDLLAHAEIAVRFPHVDNEHSSEFLQWCAERELDPDAYWYVSCRALDVASRDARSHPLLLRALATEDDLLLSGAIQGLARQHDIASLPIIQSAIERVPSRANWVAMTLAYFHDERADALARKYFESENDAEVYRQLASQ